MIEVIAVIEKKREKEVTEAIEGTEEEPTEEEVDLQEDLIVEKRKKNCQRMLLRPKSNSTIN